MLTRIFDSAFVNQLFHVDDRGATIFYPNGRSAQGYLVPPEKEPTVRAGVRRLVLFAFASSILLVSILPRVLEGWLGFEIPLPWFIGYAAIATVGIIALIIKGLSRLTVDVAPASG